MDISGEKALATLQQAMAERLAGSRLKERVDEFTHPYRELMTFYKCAMMEVETKFRVLNEEFSPGAEENPISTIKTRLKSPESILDKLQRNNWTFSVESIEANINDIAGVRVICPFRSDIYLLADALLSQDDVTLVAKKDYIANPKPNGYRSLHLIVSIPIFLHDEKRMMKVEVQLRTLAMDMWADLEHRIRYKKDRENLSERADESLFVCAQLSDEVDRRMEAIHSNKV